MSDVLERLGLAGLRESPRPLGRSPDVLVDASALDSAHRTRGIGRYVSGLIGGFADVLSGEFGRGDVSLASLRLGGSWPDAADDGSGATSSRRLAASIPQLVARRPPVDYLGRWLVNEIALPGEVRSADADLFHATEPWSIVVSDQFATVATVHDLIPLKFPEHYFGFEGGGPAKWLYFRVMSALERWRHCDRLIAVSRATKRSILRFLDVDPEDVTVVPNGIDRDAFERVDDREERRRVTRRYGVSTPFVLYLGGYDYRKNVGTLVRALPHLPETADLVLAGDMDEGTETDLRREAREVGCEERLACIGYVDETDLDALYSAASVFAYPSLAEGFGLQVLEAMATGCPVVAGFATSLPEVVGDAGLLVNPSDPRAVGGAVARLLDDADLRAELRRRGFERVEDFTWRETARQTLEVYESLLREGA